MRLDLSGVAEGEVRIYMTYTTGRSCERLQFPLYITRYRPSSKVAKTRLVDWNRGLVSFKMRGYLANWVYIQALASRIQRRPVHKPRMKTGLGSIVCRSPYCYPRPPKLVRLGVHPSHHYESHITFLRVLIAQSSSLTTD